MDSEPLGHLELIKFKHEYIPVNPRSTQIWRRLEIFRGAKQASEGRGIEAKFQASLGAGGGGEEGAKRGVQFIAWFLYVPLPMLRAASPLPKTLLNATLQ